MATPISSSVTGIAGFDTTAAVDGLLAFSKLEISQAQKKQAAQTTKQNAFVAINDAMLAFKSTATAMADSAKFFAYAASLGSSSSAVTASSLLNVTGTDSVSAGKHSIIVQQIAQAERLSSSAGVKNAAGTAITSDLTALNLTGSFNIGTMPISVAAGDTLQDIAASINQQNKGASATGVSASVLKVANNDYRLVLSSDATGATGFSLTGTALDVGGTLANLQLGAAGLNARQSLQTPQDAQVSIDGLTLTRSSNSISDALSGVTLNLKQANATVTVNMDISVDTAALTANVQSFVDAYNKVQSLVNNQFKFNPNTNTTGVLAGEGILTSIQSTLSNSLLQSVPGLANDRNSMVMIGVEPNEKGQLVINNARFDNFLTTDPTAIRDVFVANGKSSNTQLQFLGIGLNTPSGTYPVNITQAASKASVLGTTNLTAGLAAAETITFTDTASTRQAIVSLIAGQSQASIVSALNTEFAKVNTEKHELSGSLGATGVTTASTLSSLGFSIAAGDTISIAGTSRSGLAINSTFSVLNPATDTVGTLLSAIQTAFNQQVLASLDATTGKIQVTDAQSGDSLLTANLTANNEGLGSLNFGADILKTEGRYAMGLNALATGTGITIEAKNFGAGSNFGVVQSVDGLGIVNSSYTGNNIVGTINGTPATGSGQLLIGNSGNVDGLGVFYTGSATGAIGDITLGVGLGAKMEGILDLFSNPFTGLIQGSIASSQSTFDNLTKKIADLQVQMEQQRTSLIKSFSLMQKTMSTLQNTGSYLSQQVNAGYGKAN